MIDEFCRRQQRDGKQGARAGGPDKRAQRFVCIFDGRHFNAAAVKAAARRQDRRIHKQRLVRQAESMLAIRMASRLPAGVRL